jgi:hypothetical protein
MLVLGEKGEVNARKFDFLLSGQKKAGGDNPLPEWVPDSVWQSVQALKVCLSSCPQKKVSFLLVPSSRQALIRISIRPSVRPLDPLVRPCPALYPGATGTARNNAQLLKKAAEETCKMCTQALPQYTDNGQISCQDEGLEKCVGPATSGWQ